MFNSETTFCSLNCCTLKDFKCDSSWLSCYMFETIKNKNSFQLSSVVAYNYLHITHIHVHCYEVDTLRGDMYEESYDMSPLLLKVKLQH